MSLPGQGCWLTRNLHALGLGSVFLPLPLTLAAVHTKRTPSQPATGRDDVAFSLLKPIVARRDIRLPTGLHFRLTTCPTFRASSRDPLRDPGAERIVTVEILPSICTCLL